MYIKRKIEDLIERRLFKQKAVIIYGPRQTGKTTLVKKIVENSNISHIWLNADEPNVRLMLSDATSAQLRAVIGENKIIVIDEAQRISNIGLTLKLIVDNIPDVQVIATGSSSFELANNISEPLTGRKFEYLLLPFSFEEISNKNTILQEKGLVEDRIIYGYYPDIVLNSNDRKELLKQLSDSYLYKDILKWEKIQKTDKIEKLLQALALQIGNEVSFYELSQIIGLDTKTVEKYILVLEQAFIVFRLKSFSRNIRNELKKRNKIYFIDTGIRNAIINNFNPLSLRNDMGNIWENFVISERYKYLLYNNIFTNKYFWRNQTKQEIDYLEERNGKILAYEIKWNQRKKVKFPDVFIKTYHPRTTQIITRENFDEFL